MGENWSLSQEEDLHRQGLFRKARKPSRSYRKPMACASGPSRNGPRWSMTPPNVGTEGWKIKIGKSDELHTTLRMHSPRWWLSKKFGRGRVLEFVSDDAIAHPFSERNILGAFLNIFGWHRAQPLLY